MTFMTSVTLTRMASASIPEVPGGSMGTSLAPHWQARYLSPPGLNAQRILGVSQSQVIP